MGRERKGKKEKEKGREGREGKGGDPQGSVDTLHVPNRENTLVASCWRVVVIVLLSVVVMCIGWNVGIGP